jgi:hypothetical protein
MAYISIVILDNIAVKCPLEGGGLEDAELDNTGPAQ